MPVYVDHSPSGKPPAADCIEIGVINNMPDGALQSTERQFVKLLESAADDVEIRLTFYGLPDVPRSSVGRHLSRFYSSIESLWDRHLDGLIVTGAEPRTPSLTNESYWASLTKLIDWAEHNTQSTIFSCLAAHAAVLHLDGIGRRRLNDKRFGLFDCARVSDHPLLAGIPSRLTMPHSRWNDLPESELTARGYRILTRSEDAGVDAFVKQRKSLFVFFQGHPEYEANTLLLEYRRDIGRYLKRERETYPAMPNGYFHPDTTDTLSELRGKAISAPHEQLLAEFPCALLERTLSTPWQPTATLFYRNWLMHLSTVKERQLPLIPTLRPTDQVSPPSPERQ
jgi:homoserine O-succinyltransferase